MNKSLFELSTQKGFESKQNITTTDENYYYLWMCELQQWLRKEHKFHIVIYVIGVNTTETKSYRYDYMIFNLTNQTTKDSDSKIGYLNYEEALENGLLTIFKLITYDGTTY